VREMRQGLTGKGLFTTQLGAWQTAVEGDQRPTSSAGVVQAWCRRGVVERARIGAVGRTLLLLLTCALAGVQERQEGWTEQTKSRGPAVLGSATI
jgi:hypothetical protein